MESDFIVRRSLAKRDKYSMNGFKTGVIFFICILFTSGGAAWAGDSAMLIVRPASEGIFRNALDGADPGLQGREDGVMVVGTINAPSFGVESVRQMALYDAAGKLIPLLIDTSSLYSEFDDENIDSLRIGFMASEAILGKGALRLEWGDGVLAENREVDRIRVYREHKDRYRTFDWRDQPKGDDGEKFATTLEVIVDDVADMYYLWYLLPMALIFILLFVRKSMLK